MSVARFVADQRTNYRVPVAFTCRLLGVSVSWVYKWLARTAPDAEVLPSVARRREVDQGLGKVALEGC